MELTSRIRWGAVIVAIVMLLIVGIIGVTAIARNIFNDDKTTSTSVEEKIPLSDYNRPGVRVILEVQGPVVAKENRVSYRLIVSRTERIAQVIRGYNGAIEKEERLDNTEGAFGAFLEALGSAGFDRVRDNADTSEDKEDGVCASGRHYIYSIEEDGISQFRAWGTSCSRDQGTTEAPRAVRTLFEKQFPNFSKFISGLGLR